MGGAAPPVPVRPADMRVELVLIACGFASLYGPSFWDLFHGIWMSDAQGQGPIVLGLSLWLIWRKWPEISALRNDAQPVRGAWVVLVVGALLYALGRAQGIYIFEIGSFLWMTAGSIWLLFGFTAVRRLWFALFFMLFMIPLPGPFVDAVTQPMKMAVSYVAENVLFAFGYPISRTGVTLQIGQYQLLVADACAGLNTLFTLEALGLLYLNVVRHSSAMRNLLLAILIVPISFTANVIRVITLTLITYYFGDEAGQGFLHGFAGMVLFLCALTLIILADSALRVGHRLRRGVLERT